MAGLPSVVEAALRGRVSTELDLVEARITWCALEGFIGVEPRVVHRLRTPVPQAILKMFRLV